MSGVVWAALALLLAGILVVGPLLVLANSRGNRTAWAWGLAALTAGYPLAVVLMFVVMGEVLK